jgi:transposase InsO family protein
MSTADIAKLVEQFQQQHESDQLLMRDLIQQMTKIAVKSDLQQNSPAPSPEIIIESLTKSISEFTYDPDTDSTFENWYRRYADLFDKDAENLDDPAKVRLLMRKLCTQDHTRYVNYILPKSSKDFVFAPTVEKLKKLFGPRKSQLSIRYKCLQLSKEEDMDFITYTGIVNKQCEDFKLTDFSLEQFKCLIFVLGLKTGTDKDIRIRLLSKLEKEKAITLHELSEECLRMINLRRDTSMIEKPVIQQVTVNKIANSKHNHFKGNNKNFKQNTNTKVNNSNSSGIPKTPCWNCGEMHFSKFCTFSNHVCTKCNQIGHKDGYCNNPISNKKSKQSQTSKQIRETAHKVNTVAVKQIDVQKRRKYVTANINGTSVTFQYDTAADLTIISEETFNFLNIANSRAPSEQAKTASGSALQLKCEFDCQIEFQGKTANGICSVSTVKDLNVFGTDWIEIFNLSEKPVNSFCNNIKLNNNNDYAQVIAQKFPNIIKTDLGLSKLSNVRLQLKPNSQPIFRAKRPVAYASQQAVVDELNRLQQLGVISPVTHSEWAAPIVVTRKANGSIRVCGDYSTGLNASLESHQYPLPNPEDIIANLSNAQYFSHIDLSDAFLQIPVDDNSKHLLTINTHIGLFQYNRMPFGIKTAPGKFQQDMDQVIAGIEGTTAYLDDIFVSGSTQQLHDTRLIQVLQRLNDFGFHIKMEKCKFALTEITYLGYVISRDSIKPDPNRIKSIIDMPQPTNISELRSFLGAVNFYAKFVKRMHTLRGPLDELLKKDVPWTWDSLHQQQFIKLRDIMSSDLLLTPFNPNLEIIVAGDASKHGIGAIIMHQFENGTIKPIWHASRSLTPAERNYSQIEKEALSLVFAVKKFHKMIFGRPIKLHTDHKPLLAIFGAKRGIPAHSANRLQRWALILMAYDFTIQYISTNSFGYADVLSRLINQQVPPDEEFVIAAIKTESSINQVIQQTINQLPLTHKQISYETSKDIVLQQVLQYVQNNWNSYTNTDNIELQQYYHRRNELTFSNDCLLFGDRVVIPKIFRKRVLKQIHKAHLGIQLTKSIARNYVYWPKIDQDIENLVKSCEKCATAAKAPNKTLLHSWPTPAAPWQRIHIDYAGPINSTYFLVIVDAYSKWPEIITTKSISATVTVEIMKEVCNRFGSPHEIVSDNGTQFTSSQFQQFCKQFGIEHIRTCPYHPASNGQAERFVDTFKRSLKKLEGEGSMKDNLQTFLRAYRSTSNSNTPNHKSPAEHMLGRPMRTELDLVKEEQKPAFSRSEKDHQRERQFNQKHGAKQRTFTINELVYVQTHHNGKWSWTPGTITSIIGDVVHHVSTANGTVVAHTNQIQQRYDNIDESSSSSQGTEGIDSQTATSVPRDEINDKPTLRRGSRQRRPPIYFSNSNYK